ncbi:uncharacterized protein BO72DRAFT_98874 [Aspergillus fijiensis CBS 313.89]|uniref:Uncharacterized protein n=1 Tax=Aspergillus fijiensis CBS 313.89 TaxID=1448319 RepID=A0A8G1W2C3_9EURO|nr:uncharacterized protein BO72DRAFT_98874 [Aspergillus fijiensis CBS 313.89]RAK77899.1 hypothetical protein BO72DRAFT_98874 [Aspergillus fijiensis CBS 313.89]
MSFYMLFLSTVLASSDLFGGGVKTIPRLQSTAVCTTNPLTEASPDGVIPYSYPDWVVRVRIGETKTRLPTVYGPCWTVKSMRVGPAEKQKKGSLALVSPTVHSRVTEVGRHFSSVGGRGGRDAFLPRIRAGRRKLQPGLAQSVARDGCSHTRSLTLISIVVVGVELCWLVVLCCVGFVSMVESTAKLS